MKSISAFMFLGTLLVLPSCTSVRHESDSALNGVLASGHNEEASANKSVVEYILRMPSHSWAYGWTLYHFRELNDALARFVSQERGMNSKCLVVPEAVGYAVVWIRSDWEEPVTEAQKKKADAIIDSYLWGADYERVTKELKEAKMPE